MIIPIRGQNDGLNDEASDEAGTDTSGEPDMARQEFKEEADINVLLKKFGVTPNRELTYTEADFDLDLQQALTAIAEAREAFTRMPPVMLQKYPTWQALLTGLDTGQFKIDYTEATKPIVTPPPATEPA